MVRAVCRVKHQLLVVLHKGMTQTIKRRNPVVVVVEQGQRLWGV
jgi:hypothetical protein